jgi:hypothetical protein
MRRGAEIKRAAKNEIDDPYKETKRRWCNRAHSDIPGSLLVKVLQYFFSLQEV